jgi:hypothetical protein
MDPRDTRKPSLYPFEIVRFIDSRPAGPKGIDATYPVARPANAAFIISLMIFI